MRLCYYVAVGCRNGPPAAGDVQYPTRVYHSETRARQEAEIAAREDRRRRLDVGALSDIPAWATQVETLNGQLLPPEAVPDDDASIYTMLYRPATQYGTLPPGTHVAGWTSVPRELAGRFPNHPVSERTFGEFFTNRPLTERELRDYQIEVVG